MSEAEDKGYTVKDRRFFSQSEEEKERLRQEGRQAKAAYEEASGAADSENPPEGPSATLPLTEITFAAFLMSLSSSAFMHLGDIPDPGTGETVKDLPLAKQTIDLLGLLRQKTQNNLAEDEERLFDHLLYELRMRYIKEAAPSGRS